MPGPSPRDEEAVIMRSALATINFGDFLCKNARESFLDAARRWHAEFVEVTEKNGIPGVLPYHQKWCLFDLCNADRIFYIDADAIIRQDAPSPFDLCPQEDFGAVEDETTDSLFAEDLIRNMQEDHHRINEALGTNCPFPDTYFNSGVMIVSRDVHQFFLKRCLELNKRITLNLTFWDQGIINYLILRDRIRTTALERTWNHTAPDIFGHWNGMEAYVYHFAGSGDRFTVLPRISWKQPPEPWYGLHALEFQARQLRIPQGVDLDNGALHYIRKKWAGTAPQLVCYGPYFSMEPGRWEIHLDLEAECDFMAALMRRPLFQLSVTSRNGATKHATFHIRGNFKMPGDYRFQFKVKKPEPAFEFVIHSFPLLRELKLKRIILKRIEDAT